MRNRVLIVAVLAAVAAAGGAPVASATTMKFVTGATVASGAGFTAALKAGTGSVLNGGATGSITCPSSSFAGSLGTNPNSPSVTGSIASWTSSNCTDTIPFVTVTCVMSNVGPGANAKTVTFTYAGSASTMTIAGLSFTICFSNGTSCTYAPLTEPATAQHNSLTNPWNNEYAFNAVALTRTGGTTLCPANPTWTATYLITSGGTPITIQP